MQPKHLSLLELQSVIKQAINALPDTYWVVGEINELKISAAGHCFMELVQKAEDGEHIEAKVNANIWSNVFRMLQPYFETTTGARLTDGIKVLLRVAVQYHELYGLSLNVVDIDPAYTVGELEMMRRKTIAQLQKDGIFDMNRELELELLPKRIAIVSSKQAAGYMDFMNQLHKNSYGYSFSTTLFHATMQGKEAEESIIAALESIHAQVESFDVVAILRGGGSQSDLSCFDSYILASNVAQFPLPVITGIGHDKDMGIVDMVAHTMLKTPTAAAEFLVEQFEMQEQYLTELLEQVSDAWQSQVQEYQYMIQQCTSNLIMLSTQRMSRESERVGVQIPIRIKNSVSVNISSQHQRIEGKEKSIQLLDPRNILQRGYSITLHNEERVKNMKDVKPGDMLKTILYDGEFYSEVKSNK
jgi:exodeoxyribonuclease VII large subunit